MCCTRSATTSSRARPTDRVPGRSRETTLIWDRRTGAPLHNALVWQDTRNDRLVSEFARDGGRDAIAHRAHEFEHAREHALEQTHAYHNGSALMELGIVLSTASAIIGSRMLVVMALGLGDTDDL